jgi:hypothetical protein
MTRLVLALLLLLPVLAQAQCTKTKTNVQGSSGADVTVSSTAVTVAAANTSRCSLLIYNNSANDMRCAPQSDRTPTSSAGQIIASKQWFKMDKEGQDLWACIRTGSSDAAATVTEALP